MKTVKTFATKRKGSGYGAPSEYEYFDRVDFSEGKKVKVPADAGKAEYIYVDGALSVSIYKKSAGEKKSKKQAEAEKALRDGKAALVAASKLAYEMRREFVKNYHGGPKDMPAILELAVFSIMRGGWTNPAELSELLDIQVEDDDYQDTKMIARLEELVGEAPQRTLLVLLWTRLGDAEKQYYFRPYDLRHEANARLDAVYRCLCKLGYEMSDEEKALQDGSHELFVKEG